MNPHDPAHPGDPATPTERRAMLRVVANEKPSARQAVIERVKAIPRPDGAWQCNRCGSRTSLTTENGVMSKNGRKQGGTVIDKDVCAECWKQGIYSPMRPSLKQARAGHLAPTKR